MRKAIYSLLFIILTGCGATIFPPLSGKSPVKATSHQNNNVDKAIQWIKEACVTSGREVEISGTGKGEISIKRVGAEAGAEISIKQHDGLPIAFGREMMGQATEMRKCMGPYIERIVSALLGDTTVSDGKKMGIKSPSSPLGGQWKGFLRTVDNTGKELVLQDRVVLQQSGEAIVGTITQEMPSRDGSTKSWNLSGYARQQFLILTYLAEEPTVSGIGSYILIKDPGAEIFVGYVIGTDCDTFTVQQVPYILMRKGTFEDARATFGYEQHLREPPRDILGWVCPKDKTTSP